MQVSLKVVGGKNDGREIKISVPEFIIGRGEQAHLRPASDLVSRKHCAVKLRDGKVVIEDLGSRNGTFINGKTIEQPHVVQIGDVLRVGRLQFEVVLDHAKPVTKSRKSKAWSMLRLGRRLGPVPSRRVSVIGWRMIWTTTPMKQSSSILKKQWQ